MTKASTKEMNCLVQNELNLPYFTNAMLVIVLSLPKEKAKFILDVCFKNFLVAFQVRATKFENFINF